jgi:hypothetical protein
MVVDTGTYLERRRAHETRVERLLAPFEERRRLGVTHPVDDFLFTYYSHRRGALRRWDAGFGVGVRGAGALDFAGRRGYRVDHSLAFVDPAWIATRHDRVSWIHDLLTAIAGRPAQLGCLGLHEWAMVYRLPTDDVRHARYPLRLGSRGTDAVVETHRLSCTHFDAFRFFTGPARPRNAQQPTRAAQQALDQPGCLHASMDLYKWAYKLTPLVPSELVADCFELALEIRQVDMAASPYDLSSLDIEPIPIETPAGKAAYLAAQRKFAVRAAPLRAQLVDVCAGVFKQRRS